MIRISLLTIALSFSFAACGGDDEGGENPNTCDTSTLTYDNFASGFFTSFCTDCHSGAASNRQGAPSSVDLETLALVTTNKARAKARAGAATSMPPSNFSMTPSAQERADLVEWIDCGLKN